VDKNVVIITPHCDDEYLGCSTILKQGNVRKIIVVAPGETGRLTETENCAEKYKVTELESLNLEDGKVITDLNFLYFCLRDLLYFHGTEDKPTIYIPSLWERHLDHKAVAFVALLVCQKFGIKPIMYTVWDSLPFFTKKVVFFNVKEKIKEFKELYPTQSNLISLDIFCLKNEEFLEYDTLVSASGKV